MLDILNFNRTGSKHFRRRRIELCYEIMGITSATKVIDIGGGVYFWNLAKEVGLPLPASVVILNLHPFAEPLPEWCSCTVGDATKIPFEDGRFDLAFSNSVIEHMGSPRQQAAMAAEVRRVAKSYWVQTPDPRFPIEPHYSTPLIHWLPRDAMRAALPFTPWAVLTKQTTQELDRWHECTRLVPRKSLQAMFPEATILVERFAGLPKSLIAFHKADS